MAIARTVLLLIGAWVLVVWLVGLGYIVVTLLESRGRLPARTKGELARSLLKEFWYIAWTQPLLPLFQLTGRRLNYRREGTPIVLVHGYFQNRVDFLYLARRLHAAGSGPLQAYNFFWPQSLKRSAASLIEFVEYVRRRTGAEHVDLLTHSSGGLLAMDLLTQRPELVRRACVIAIPWRGVSWRGPVIGRSGSQLRTDSLYTLEHAETVVGAPVLSIYSVHDNLVHPATTSRLSGAQTSHLEVKNLGHLAILFDRQVGDAVCEFLLASESAEGQPHTRVGVGI